MTGGRGEGGRESKREGCTGRGSGGEWMAESDKRVKCNIEDANLDECIDVLKSINLKKYNTKADLVIE